MYDDMYGQVLPDITSLTPEFRTSTRPVPSSAPSVPSAHLTVHAGSMTPQGYVQVFKSCLEP